MTMSQKILAAHAGLEEVKAGQLIEADLDLVLGNDITSPVAINLSLIHICAAAAAWWTESPHWEFSAWGFIKN